ncbi:MAG: sulfonate transport system substrate-binding protein [Micromonosporaceae bacterium]
MTTAHRPALRLVALLAATALASTGCAAARAKTDTATGNASTDLSTVTLRVGDQKGTGAQALLSAAGLLTGIRYRIVWSTFTSGPPMLQAMGAGAIDVGGVGNAPPVFAAAGGEKIAAVGALRANPLGSAILVPAGSPLTSPEQLRGKRIAVAQGSSAHYHLLTVLRKAGLSIGDVKASYLQPANALAAFTSGHVDAWDVWSPYTEQAVAQTHAKILVNGVGYGSPYSFTIAARAALADPGKVAAIRDYLGRIARAHTWANSHVDDWAKVWARGAGLPQDVMLVAAKDAASTATPVDDTVISSEQEVADAFTEAGLIPRAVTFADFAVRDFNDTVGGPS